MARTRPIIEIGSRVGKLVILQYAGQLPKSGNHTYLCECDCGNIKIVTASRLKKLKISSATISTHIKKGKDIKELVEKYRINYNEYS